VVRTGDDVRPLAFHALSICGNYGDSDMAVRPDLLEWLRAQCAEFVFLPVGVYVERGEHDWPFVATSPADLTAKLDEGGHLAALPKESAALANVIEVALVDFLLDRLDRTPGATGRRGEERSYPDLEIGGEAFGGTFHAVDVKMARLAKNGKQTQSRCTLYTGNTYFKWPTIRWPGMFRPFDDYATHLDIIGVYRLDVDFRGRVRDLELFVHEPWRIAFKERSSTTREYLGAVVEVAALREGRGSSRLTRPSTGTGGPTPSGCPRPSSASSKRRCESRRGGRSHTLAVASSSCSICGPPRRGANLAGSKP
jgi:hypothetical protein